MGETYLTKDGDVLDWVLWKYYGTVEGRIVERVLEANPGLADYGAVMPGGVRIFLPDFKAPISQTEGTRLWD
jgi:phage tail protein X